MRSTKIAAFLLIIGAIAADVVLLSLGPSSFTRNVLIIFVSLSALFISWVIYFYQSSLLQRRAVFFVFLGWTLLFLALALYPPERLPGLWEARQRFLVPVWAWLAWGGFLLAGQTPYAHPAIRRLVKFLKEREHNIRPWMGLSLLLSLSAILVYTTRWGLVSPWALNWQGFPTPILSQHIWAFAVILFCAWAACSKMYLPPWASRIGGWLLILLLWIWVKPEPNYFLTPPYPPNYESYPFSDARYYVLAGEQAVLGYGYGSRPYTTWAQYGHPLLGKFAVSVIFASLRLLSFNYLALFFFWLALIALTGWLMYSLGVELHSRSAGLALAVLLALRETAAFTAATRLDATHAKNFMTEPLLRLIFVALAYILLRWWHVQGWEKAALGLLIGALLGWTTLTRTESLVVVAGLIAAGALFSLRKPKTFLGLLALALGLFAVWIPWMMRTHVLTQNLNPRYRTFWFFGTKIRAAASSEYRPPPTPTPTPTPEPQPDAFGTDASSRIVYTRPTKGLLASSPQPEPTATSSDSWLERLRGWLQRVPIIGSFLQWSRETWLYIWHYIGRNIVTTWTMFPWTPRFYTALQITYLRPLAEGRPLQGYHWPIWFFNLSLVALGLVAVWRRIRWAVMLPWLIYGFYVLGLAIGRTGGGRYIVPIDWIPVTFYVIGWVVVLYAFAQMLGLSPSAHWWRWPGHVRTRFSQRRTAHWLLWAEGLALLSALGVGLEVYHVWRSVQTPEPLPPRHRRVTWDEVFARLDEWDVWSYTSMSPQDLRTRIKSLHLVPEWGFAYFPRYVAAGEYCGDWCGYLTPKKGLLFFNSIGTLGQAFFVIPQEKVPEPFEMGSEMIALLCPSKKPYYYREAILVVLRDTQGRLHVFENPRPACDYDFQAQPSSKDTSLSPPWGPSSVWGDTNLSNGAVSP
ncbi:MAG: hypothetical protein GXN93_02300 [Candidatus Diapherotrites archaeon]|nr:hypothetical protein [Candidatus Diapherotrites archaeon]